jgi:hypothetical protein
LPRPEYNCHEPLARAKHNHSGSSSSNCSVDGSSSCSGSYCTLAYTATYSCTTLEIQHGIQQRLGLIMMTDLLYRSSDDLPLLMTYRSRLLKGRMYMYSKRRQHTEYGGTVNVTSFFLTRPGVCPQNLYYCHHSIMENLMRPRDTATRVVSCHARYDLLDAWYKSCNASNDHVKSTSRVQASCQ